MNGSIFVFFILLTGVLSAWNAYAAGAYLTESKTIGGTTSALIWFGLVASGCGFTWIIFSILGLVAVANGNIPPTWSAYLIKAGFVVIVLPALGSLLAIRAENLIRNYRKTVLGNTTVAAWNNHSSSYSTWETSSHKLGIVSDIIDSFFSSSRRSRYSSSSNNDSGGSIIFVLVFLLALFGGIALTTFIARWADRRVAMDVVGFKPHIS